MSYLGKATKLGKDLDQVKVNEVVKLDETLDDFCCRPGKKGLIPEWEALKDNVNKAVRDSSSRGSEFHRRFFTPYTHHRHSD